MVPNVWYEAFIVDELSAHHPHPSQGQMVQTEGILAKVLHRHPLQGAHWSHEGIPLGGFLGVGDPKGLVQGGGHTEKDIELTLEKASEAFGVVKREFGD